MKKLLVFLILAVSSISVFAQQRPPPIATNDESGFVQIFHGKSLAGWEGDTNYWRVENGCLVGEITPDKLLKVNSFIVWHGGETRDFELKVEYRITTRGNSGINYRSVMATNGPWAMKGYQADIDGVNRYTGQNYEEKGRTFLALRGQVTRIVEGQTPQIIGSLGATNELLSIIKTNDWNEYHLIVSGNVMTHILNGRVMSVVIDEDAANRKFDGMLGVQVHVGPPMKIEYRNFRLKKLNGT
jgi:molybdopterin-binding protein